METKPKKIRKKPNLELFRVGKFIKEQRELQNISLRELSKKSFGNTHSATKISLIERAMYPNASFVMISQLVNALGHRLV